MPSRGADIEIVIERQWRDLPPAVRRWGRKGLSILEKDGRRFFRPRTLLHLRIVPCRRFQGRPEALKELPAPVIRWLEGETGRSLRGLCLSRGVSYNPTKQEKARMLRTVDRLGAKVTRNLERQGITTEEWERRVDEAVADVRAQHARARNAALTRWRRVRARR